MLASCGEDRTIRLWKSEPGQLAWSCVAVLEEGHQRTIRWCAWSPDARFLASCSFDGTASVWEYNDGDFDCVASLEGHENEVKAVSWSASGQLLATCGRDKSVFIWEAEDEMYEVAAVLHSHAGDVKAVAWHPALEVLASASYDDTLKLYSVAGDEWQLAATLTGHTSTVWALAFSPDGTALASCSDDRAVMLWRQKGSAECDYAHAATLREVHERPIYAIDWARHGGGGLLATAGGDDAVGLLRPSFDAQSNACSLTLVSRRENAHSGDVNSVGWRPMPSDDAAASPQGGWLATCGDDGRIRLWRCETP